MNTRHVPQRLWLRGTSNEKVRNLQYPDAVPSGTTRGTLHSKHEDEDCGLTNDMKYTSMEWVHKAVPVPESSAHVRHR